MKQLPRLPAPITRVILALLQEHGELHGLRIVEKASGRVLRGSVYVLLQRAERMGWVTSEERERESPGPRIRWWRLTPDGERALRLVAALEALA